MTVSVRLAEKYKLNKKIWLLFIKVSRTLLFFTQDFRSFYLVFDSDTML